MAKIRITSTPPGFAPPEILEQWVGVVIKVNEQAIRKELAEDHAWDNFKVDEGGPHVMAEDAIQALIVAGKDDAAMFWMEMPGRMYRFSPTCCELIED